jgi:sugar phosphate isomerase/epimerase
LAEFAGKPKRRSNVFVAASSRCFAELSLDAAMQQLVELEYSYVEIMLHENDGQLKPSEVAADFARAVQLCRQTHRMTPVALSVEPQGPEERYYAHFAACCKLAKALRVVTVTVRASELGTPYNAEVERLRKLIALGAAEGVRVGVLTEVGRMTQNPHTAVALCESVKGLGITLDPSHYIYGAEGNVNYEPLLRHVFHVRLRDTARDRIQVRVGQGEVEYGRLINQLGRYHYNRALCVDILPLPEVDQLAELRKMRLLLESLLS